MSRKYLQEPQDMSVEEDQKVPPEEEDEDAVIEIATTIVTDRTSELSGKKSLWKRLFPLIVFGAIHATVAILFVIFRKPVLASLAQFGRIIQGLGFWGYIIVALTVMLTTVPPVPGFGAMSALSGVIYGVKGFIPFYAGAIVGSTITVILFRKTFSSYTGRLRRENPKLSAVVKAVENKGFSLLFWIRLAPYPFGLMNVLLAGTKIPILHIVIATILTQVKMIAEVLIGANLDQISDGLLDHPSILNWLLFFGFFIIAVCVVLYVAWIGKKAIHQLHEENRTSHH